MIDINKKHFLISFKEWESQCENHYTVNKAKIGWFTDKELMDFCDGLEDYTVTYLGDKKPKLELKEDLKNWIFESLSEAAAYDSPEDAKFAKEFKSILEEFVI